MNAHANMIAALDRRTAPLRLFVRDDDAGWDNPRLFALLDCLARVLVPIDLAVIAQAADARLAQELRARVDAARATVGLHQHGFAHVNHEPAGRKCEFGPARTRDAQRDDLQAGRARLHDLFGHRVDAIFTPPWNRCTPATALLLAELGYAALSRDRGAPAQDALRELPVDVDWCKVRRSPQGAEESIAAALGAAIRDRAADDAPVGLMLHHAQMDESDLGLLTVLLGDLRCHGAVRFVSMRAALAESPTTTDA